MSNLSFIKQNNPECQPALQRVGCFVRAAMHMGELASGAQLTPKQINYIWEWGLKEGFISKEFNLRESAPIANKAIEVLQYHGKIYEVGTFTKGELSWYPSVPGNMRRIDFVIQKIKQNGPEGTHFRNVTRNGKLLWDPHEPEIRVKGIFYSIIYAYVS